MAELNIREDFQATVKAIREDMGGEKYPKAVMTASQFAKCTATIIGGPGCNHEMARQIIDSDHLYQFMKSQNATAIIEKTKDTRRQDAYLVRIHFHPKHLFQTDSP